MVTNNIKLVAQTIAPNPIEIDYWIDLKSDPNGSVIRYYKDNKWVDLLNSGEQELTDLIKQFNELKEQVNSIQDTNTVYTFKNGNGSFTVTPSGGSAQTVSIGKPATAGTADTAKSVAWDNVSGKPSTYAPSSHTHTVSQITDFPELANVATTGSYADLTGKPTNATTSTAGLMSSADKQNLDNLVSNTAGYQTESQVDAKIAALVDSAPETLDTLNELAAALGDDPSFITTITNQITNKADNTVATTSTNGLMSSTDKQKLDSVEENANHYVLPTATASVLGGVKSSTTGTTSDRDYKVQINSDGTMKVNVPWTDNNTTYNVASTSANGLMSSTDKTKLDGIASNANNYTLPTASASTKGGVKQATSVADTTIDGTETATTVATTLNSLLAALRTAGILAS